jgi:hypothetical protein
MNHPQFLKYGTPITKVIEECSELIQILCKVERFGWFSFNPLVPNSENNFELTKKEMDDVVEAIERLQEEMRQIKYDHFLEQK